MSGHERILHPTDGTETSEAALEEAITQAEAFDARIEAVSVVDVTAFPGSPSQAAIDRVESAAQAAVDRATERVTREGIPVDAHVEHGAAVATIADLAGDGADLVVMGTHGRTGIEHFLVGSVAEKTIREVSVPVIAVPGPD